MHLRKGMAVNATVFVLLALIGNVAVLSVGVGGFKDVLGMASDSNAGNKIEKRVVTPVRNVCVQGETADERTSAFTLSSKINVSLVSEEKDPKNDQSIRALLVGENSQLLNSEPIQDCMIEFNQEPSTYRVFEEGQPYQLTITGGKQGENSIASISVEER